MQITLMGWIHQLGTLEYWEALLAGFEGLGPLVPILLAMVESFFPPLPLIAGSPPMSSSSSREHQKLQDDA